MTTASSRSSMLRKPGKIMYGRRRERHAVERLDSTRRRGTRRMAAAPRGRRELRHARRKKAQESGPDAAAPSPRESWWRGSSEALAAERRRRRRRVVHCRGSADPANALQEQHRALGISAPDGPPTITPSPGAKVSSTQPYCFIAVEGERLDDPDSVAAGLAHRQIDVRIAPVVLGDRALRRSAAPACRTPAGL